MNTTVQNRLLGVQLLALALAIVGEFLGTTALVAIGITGFFLALALLLVTMALALVTGVDSWTHERLTLVSTRPGR